MANEVRINVTSRDRSGPGMDSARERATKMGDSVRRVGEVAAGIVASDVFQRIAGAAKRAFTDTIAAASGLEQAVGGTEAVFGDASGAIDRFGETSAESVGLSERAFREGTTLIGGQLKRMTGDIDFAAASSIQLVQVGADLAATYGGTTKEAVDAFAAALRGEADPAERFNLNLKASVVNAKAVELGLASTTGEVDDNARAQALLALIMEQSADAQGQFARESDQHAGAQQRMNAAVEDAQAAFGEKLLPVLAAASDIAIDMLAGFQALPGPMQAVVGVLAAAAALTPGILALQAAMVRLGISIRGVLLAAGPVTAILVGLGAALAVMGQQSRDAEERQRNLVDIMRQVAAASEEERRQVAATALRQSDEAKTAAELGISLKTLTDVVLGEGDAQEQLRAKLEQTFEEHSRAVGLAGTGGIAMEEEAKQARELLGWMDELGPSAKLAADEQREYADATDVAGDSTEATTEDLEAYKASLEETKEALAAAEDEVSNLTASMFDMNEAVLVLNDAERAFEAAIDSATEAAEENGETLDRSTEKGRANEEQLDRLAGASHALIQEMISQGASTDDVTEKTENARSSFIDAATQMGLTEGAANDLADEYGLIPDDVVTTVEARDEASDRIQQIRDALDSIQRVIDVLIRIRETRTSSPGPGGFPRRPGHAAGGIVGAGALDGTAQGGGPRGGRILVGEHRPEVLEDVSLGSRVIPSVDQATDRGQLSGGGGAPTINIYVQGSIRSDRDLIELIRDEFDNGGFRGVFGDDD